MMGVKGALPVRDLSISLEATEYVSLPANSSHTLSLCLFSCACARAQHFCPYEL